MAANKHAIVTGGAGFLGSHLVDRLLEEGYRVTAVDNLVTGSLDNIAHLENDDRFRFVKCDITQPFSVDGPVDIVFNFASPASPVDFPRIPIEILLVGSAGTHHCLELAREKKARFLQASTSEVYGDPAVNPQSEEYWGNVNPIGTRSCYDEAKRYAEALIFAYRRAHNVDIRIVRIFNTYGPRMRIDDGRVVPTFLHQALLGRPLTVYGDGTQTRSFCYASDLIDGIYRLSQYDGTGPINVGNPIERTMLNFAQEIIRLTGSSSAIEYRPLPHADDPMQRRPDITKARTLLGWEPKVDLDAGIRQTIPYFKQMLEIG